MIAPDRIATLIAGLAMLGLAAWVYSLKPRDRLHQALAVFLGARGALYGLLPFSSPADDLWGRAAVVALIAIPFAAVYLASELRGRYTGSPRVEPGGRLTALGAVAAGGAAVAVATYLVRPSLFFGDLTEAPFQLFNPVTYLAYAGISLLLVNELGRARIGARSQALYTLALGFALEPAFWATFLTFQLSGPGLVVVHRIIHGLTLAVVVASAVRLWFLHRRGESLFGQGDASRFTAWVGLALASGLGIAVAFDPGGFASARALLFSLDALWHLALVALVVYAVVRHQLFDIDLKLRFAVEKSTMLSVFAVGFLVASEGLEELVPVEGTWLGIGAAVAIALALKPLQRFAEGFAGRFFPGVEDTSAYRRERALEIYRATVEAALVDGEVSSSERRTLDRLREELSLDPEEAASLERSVAGGG